MAEAMEQDMRDKKIEKIPVGPLGLIPLVGCT